MTVCTTRPRARASATPSARKAVSVKRLHELAFAPRRLRRERADQPLDEQADQGRRRQRGILFGQTAAGHGRDDAPGKLRRERFAQRRPRRVDFGFDRLGNRCEGEPAAAQRACGEGHDRRSKRRKRAGRGVAGTAQRGDLALGDFGKERRNQIGLRREVAIHRSRGNAGAGGDRRDLHRRHAAFARDLPRSGNDRVMACGQPSGDVLGAAIGH